MGSSRTATSTLGINKYLERDGVESVERHDGRAESLIVNHRPANKTSTRCDSAQRPRMLTTT